MATMVQCPACGKLNDSRLDNCVYCGAHMKAAAGKAAAPKRSLKPCPNCGAMVADTDVICRACNFNLLTRKKVDGAVAAPQPGRRQRNFMWAGTLFVVVLVIGGAGLLLYSLNMNHPVASAERLIEENKLIEAQNVLAEHVQEARDERAWYLLGRVQLRLDDYTSAAGSFEQALAINPRNTNAARWALLSMAKFPSEAVLSRMEKVLQQALVAEPNDEELLVLLGLVQGVEGNINRAASTLQDAVERFRLNDEVKLGLASIQALQGSPVQAEATLQLTSVSDNERAAVGAYIALMNGQDRSALVLLEQATQAEPGVEDSQLLYELARLYMEQGRFPEAEAAARRALDANPGHSPSRFLYAVALHAQRVDEDAIPILDQLSRGSTAEATAAAVLAAEIQLDLQNFDRASQYLSVAAQKGARDVQYLTTLGRLQVLDREFRAARLSFDRAIQADPEYASVYLESGLLHIRMNELEQGVEHLDRYLSLTRNTTVRTSNREIQALVEQLRQTVDVAATGGR